MALPIRFLGLQAPGAPPPAQAVGTRHRVASVLLVAAATPIPFAVLLFTDTTAVEFFTLVSVLAFSITVTLAVVVRRVRSVSELSVTEWRPALVRGDEAVMPPLARAFKRSCDIVLASVGLVLAFPIIAIAAVAIRRDSPGGWLYSQARVGAKGRPFRMYKLRTMVAGNDDTAHRAHMAAVISGEPVPGPLNGKVPADPRCTSIGGFLRRSSIDELPQLWNVLRGQMSLVGPRPPLPWEAELYDERARRRLQGKPGLTGLWQVSGRNRLTFEEMVELDAAYLDSWSPMQDFKILFKTPRVVLYDKDTE